LASSLESSGASFMDFMDFIILNIILYIYIYIYRERERERERERMH